MADQDVDGEHADGAALESTATGTRNAVILCTDHGMLIPALFVAASVRRHAHASPVPFDIVVVAEPGAVDARKRQWMTEQGIILHEGVDFSKHRDVRILNERLTVATLVKLLLAEEFEGRYDRILYLDCDLTIHGDLGPLFLLDTGEFPLAAQRRGIVFATRALAESSRAQFRRLGMTPPFRYFNSGVLCIDVTKWNREDLTARSLAFIRENWEICHLPDEDSLNGVLDGRFTPISPVWNMLPPRRGFTKIQRFVEPAIVHYAGHDKPWRRFGGYKPLFPDMAAYRLYRAFLRDSPWPTWLSEQWTARDLRENITTELDRLSRKLRKSSDEPDRAELRWYVARFSEHCAQDHFADVEQGIVIRENGRLRLGPSPVPAAPAAQMPAALR